MQKTKYKPGDKVLVRSDLIFGRQYSMVAGGRTHVVNDDMARVYSGRTLTIKNITDGSYRVKENNWAWTDDMFVGVIGEETDESKVKSFYDFVT